MPLAYTPAFVAIQRFDKRDPASATQVKTALAAGPLFTLGTPTTTRI